MGLGDHPPARRADRFTVENGNANRREDEQ
jgi:hypothetical protein